MAKQNKFGTFGGVFVPSILTILGVIMYLRLPTIIGEAGLFATIGIIIVAHIISVTTGLSVSSIATDKKVEAGGTYYMISRSLGLSIGGTLGLALFVGLSFSVSLYLIGFSESFLNYWGLPTDINNIRLTGSLVLLAVTTITFISTSLAMKTQYFIMAAIVLSLISIFFGNHGFTPTTPLLSNPSSSVPLMALFGIFFPAVTGFEAGVSMSGDLKDPKSSIPKGSIAAVVVGFVVYIILSIFLAYTVDGNALRTNGEILLGISLVPELVIAGIWGATLSSALGSILGAPRILQATAIDKITPKFFSKGYGKTNEPRNALLLTFIIAETGILIGSLDAIASIVSVFFITTYGFLNISAAFEYWTSADFRPEFKVSGWVSVVGAIACILVMILLNVVAMFGAIAILGLLFLYIKRKELTLESGDTWSGVWASLVKTGLTNLKKESIHSRNWRPNTIMFSGAKDSRSHIIEMGKAISGKLGILSAFELVESDDRILAKTVSDLTAQKDTVGYFQHKLYCREVYEGMDEIARVYGFSGVEPNTILMGWSKNPRSKEKFINMLENFEHYLYNTIFLNFDKEKKFGEHQSIDIWWSGSGRNLVLAIYLIRHITNSPLWRTAHIRLLTINPVNANQENIYKGITAILDSYRVDLDVKVINNETELKAEKDIIAETSKDTDLVILGIPEKKYHQLNKYYDQISHILESIGTTLIINASDKFEEIEVIQADAGKQAQLDKAEVLLELPPLQISKYAEVATDITKIDINGQKTIELFYRKTFQTIFQDHTTLLKDLHNRLSVIKKELKSIEAFPDNYRKKKAIDRLKNDVFFKINNLVADELRNTKLPKQQESLANGINWYENRLQSDFRQYPEDLTIRFPKEDFKVLDSDRSGLKSYKRIKQFKHWIIGQPITHKINYREVARYFQLNNRKVFIAKLLQLFDREEAEFYTKARKYINSIISFLDDVERKILQEEITWNSTEKLLEINGEIESELQVQDKNASLYLGRLKLEFRKNLQLMNNDLSKIDIDYIIKKKTRGPNYYADLTTEILQFPEEYQLNITTILNKILMELSVNATKNRIETLNDEFIGLLKQSITVNYIKKTEAIIDGLEKGEDLNTIQKIKLEERIDPSLKEALSEKLQKMLELTEKMPESIEIYSSKSSVEEQETLPIPIARMTEYFLKSKYETSVEEEFEIFLETLKRTVFTIKDNLNLTKFNLENTAEQGKTKKETQNLEKEIMKDCVQKVTNEKVLINERLSEFSDFTKTQLEKSFEPLASLKIEESAKDFVTGLRNYQSKQVLSLVNSFRADIEDFFQQIITRLFYSRSRGILFAKKLNKSSALRSTNSSLLDLKEQVNIQTSLVNTIPPYYHTLFSNKSNINKDFWVSRKSEEAVFEKAIARYNTGYYGAILLLGERNAGKTAFCKYILDHYKKKNQTYTIFPPTKGITSVNGFTQALRKATMKKGDAAQILSRLTPNSILIINDLELFWERTEEGMEIIYLLKQLIDEYSERIIFVINMNPHAYRIINQLTQFNTHFIEVINFTPFNAEKLKDLLMTRHRSSSLTLKYATDSPALNEVQLAQLFNKYFDYSDGNPGTALNGWLANIQNVNNNDLIISKPEIPYLTGLKDLEEEWTMLLAQFVLHKRLTSEKIGRICQWEQTKINSTLLAMSRSGIITEKAAGIYQIDPSMHPFVVKSLKEREVLI